MTHHPRDHKKGDREEGIPRSGCDWLEPGGTGTLPSRLPAGMSVDKGAIQEARAQQMGAVTMSSVRIVKFTLTWKGRKTGLRRQIKREARGG